MIKVIRIDRKNIIIFFLALVGIAFCILGLGNIAGKITSWRQSITTARSTSAIDQDYQTAKSIGGGVPVESNMASPGMDSDYATSETSDDYFVEYRMERERVRGMEMETMREVLASPETSEEVRKSAQERLMQLSNNISREMELENLIRARGYSDAAVFLDENTATVVVRAKDVTSSEENRDSLLDLVAKTTGLSRDNIIIISRE